jgi:uncharacterized protein YjiS (DUF1127 family)
MKPKEIVMIVMAVVSEASRLLNRLGRSWKRWRERAETLAGLRDAGSDEWRGLARDLGLSNGELHVLAGKWPERPDLLVLRAAALGLDVGAINRSEPRVMRDLERVCSLCAHKRSCRHDLACNPQAADWRNYCPNADTLSGLDNDRAENEKVN